MSDQTILSTGFMLIITELNNARAETERLRLEMESNARAAERSRLQYENQLADGACVFNT